MKRFIFIFTLSAMFWGCHDETPPPPHPIVGDWMLDLVMMRNLPTNYSAWEGYFFSPQEWFEDPTLNSYRISYNNDKTYLRTIDFPGPNITENGTWQIIDETSLVMSPDTDPIDDEWEIVGPIEDIEMTLSKPTSGWVLLDDTAIDSLLAKYPLDDPTLTQEEITYNQSMWDKAWTDTETRANDFNEFVSLNIWYVFNR